MTTTKRNDTVQKEGPPQAASLSRAGWLNLGLRALMETGIVVGLGYWGYQTGSSGVSRIILAIGTPLVGFGFWGAVDFHQAGRAAEGLRLLQELVVSGLAALAIWSAGSPVLGALLAAVSVVYHTLVYGSGGRLLKARVTDQEQAR